MLTADQREHRENLPPIVIKDLGTASNPHPWFKDNYVFGDQRHLWNAFKEQNSFVIEFGQGRLSFLPAPDDEGYVVKTGFAGANAEVAKYMFETFSEMLIVGKTTATKLLPGSRPINGPFILVSGVHYPQLIPTTPGSAMDFLALPPESMREYDGGIVPLVGVIGLTGPTHTPTGIVVWTHPYIQDISPQGVPFDSFDFDSVSPPQD